MNEKSYRTKHVDIDYKHIAKRIFEDKKLVVLTGAGISTNSGVPDFRSSDGLYSKYTEDDVSIEGFMNDVDYFYEAWDYKFRNVYGAKPNSGHYALKYLDDNGYLDAVITQNVDGFHEESGIREVITFHGEARFFEEVSITTTKKGKKSVEYTGNIVPREYLMEDGKLNYRKDGKLWKPNVVLFGELIDIHKHSRSKNLVAEANVALIIGTSWKVYPFANLPRYNRKRKFVSYFINNEPILDELVYLGIVGDSSETLEKIVEEIKLLENS